MAELAECPAAWVAWAARISSRPPAPILSFLFPGIILRIDFPCRRAAMKSFGLKIHSLLPKTAP